MPSFNFVSIGSNILKEKILSPYIKNISDFSVFVVSDKVYNFGKVRGLNWTFFPWKGIFLYTYVIEKFKY